MVNFTKGGRLFKEVRTCVGRRERWRENVPMSIGCLKALYQLSLLWGWLAALAQEPHAQGVPQP